MSSYYFAIKLKETTGIIRNPLRGDAATRNDVLASKDVFFRSPILTSVQHTKNAISKTSVEIALAYHIFIQRRVQLMGHMFCNGVQSRI